MSPTKRPVASLQMEAAERNHATQSGILGHYRSIGPAAVAAAVLAVKKRKPLQTAAKHA